jgi:hypothetical protein
MPGVSGLAIGGPQPYPSLEEVANLVRTIMNDDMSGATDTVGEGQIIVDNQNISVKMLNAMNEAIRQTYRQLRLVGDPTLLVDNHIVSNLPVVNGPQGAGAPDTGTQVCLGFNGFFDGTNMNSALTLPANLLVPIEVWQRQTGTNNTFQIVPQAQAGLPSIYQNQGMGSWEWRADGIWFNGSLVPYDVRLRYYRTFLPFTGPTLNFTNTYIPIIDCTSAVAYKTAYILDFSLGSPQAAETKATADAEILNLRNQQVRRAQAVPYHRQGYEEGQNNGGFGFGFNM